MSIIPLELTAEVGDRLNHVVGRWVSLRLNGIEIFSEMVYDTNAGGERTESQAVSNCLTLFASRLKRLVEENSC